MRTRATSAALIGALLTVVASACTTSAGSRDALSADSGPDGGDATTEVEDYAPAYVQADAWPLVPIRLAPVKSTPPLAGTASGGVTSVSAAALDWQRMTYPTRCLPSGQAQLIRGTLTSGGITVTARPPVYGDLDGDAAPEAVVTLTCASSSRRAPDRALVYSTARGRPELLGVALAEDAEQELLYAEFRDRTVIVVGAAYSPTAKAGTPDLAITTTSRLIGRQLKQESRYIDPMEILYEAHDGDDAH